MTLNTAPGGEITILATGGTIATVRGTDGRTRPELDLDELASAVGTTMDRYVVEQLMQVPSWALTTQDMRRIAIRARELTQTTGAGVVVTHGTTTMAYTAWLTDLFLPSGPPVVFTGAMRRADEADADGPRNLSDAVGVASSPDAVGRGAMVCFAGEIFAAREVWKRSRTSIAPFTSESGRIGCVDEQGVVFERSPFRPRTFDGDIEPAVALVKAFPDCTGAGIEAVVAEGGRGIVLEGLAGSGGIPPKMQPAVAHAAQRGVVTVLASSAPGGLISSTGGGTGEPLAHIGLIPAGDLTAEKAWVLLMVALAEAPGIDGVRMIFDELAEHTTDSEEERRR